jgi:hypothetical protein
MTQLNMNKIAKGLRAKRQGKVSSSGGYFGALQLLADIESRFRVSAGTEADLSTVGAEKLVRPRRRASR